MACDMRGSTIQIREHQRSDREGTDDEAAPCKSGSEPRTAPEANRRGPGHHTIDEVDFDPDRSQPHGASEHGESIRVISASCTSVEVNRQTFVVAGAELVVGGRRDQLTRILARHAVRPWFHVVTVGPSDCLVPAAD